MTDHEYGEIMLDQMSQEDEDWAYIEDYYDKQQDDLICNNEFFWMSKQEMLDLAEEYNNDYTHTKML